ncbi:MAG: guanylate kinase [Hyphomicrobiales bacterium]|nr:guanylate kinase [Hyphomicrobiales bacterium]
MDGAAQPAEIIRRRGFMLILSSPSGAGKSTITKNLLSDKSLNLDISISVTTRQRRSSEVDGTHYYFKTRQEFERMRASDDLLEWAEVHGNYYGTPRAPAEEALSAGREMIFDIDYQGTEQVLQRARKDAVTIFILPPSMKELKARLERRAEDAPDVIERRLEAARTQEIERWRLYDYVIVNHDVQEALHEVRCILVAERLRRSRSEEAIDGFVRNLLA